MRDDKWMIGARERVVRALRAEGRTRAADLIADKETARAERVPHAVMPQGWALLRFISYRASHPFGFAAAVGPDHVVLLSGSPENHRRFAEACGLSVESPEHALAVVVFFVEWTRDMAVPRFVVRSPEDVRVFAYGDTEEVRRRIAGAVLPPRARAALGGYQVSLDVQNADRVEHWQVTVTRGGRLRGRVTARLTGIATSYHRALPAKDPVTRTFRA